MTHTNLTESSFRTILIKRFSVMIVFLLLSGWMLVYGQTAINVSGNVFDEQGEPLLGATVIVEGEKVGVITDLNGFYSVKALPKGRLKVSFIGYTPQTVAINNKTKINITLKDDSNTLDQVVAIGYGGQRQKSITSAIVPVDVEKIANLPVSSITEALSGQIPGVSVTGGSSRPGDMASLNIRQSFNFGKDGANSVPLVVIDDVIQVDSKGMATLEQLNMLDVSEIESITVLKDGSAAIYGTRAAQGAIVVKTKRGKIGKPRISYAGKFQISDAVSHTKTMNAYEYGVFANSFLRASAIKNGKEEVAKNLFSDAELDEMRSLDYNWLDETWSSAFSMQHSINISGGSDRATYFGGFSYYDQGANLGKQDFDKYTYRTGVDIKVANGLKMSASVSGNISSRRRSFTKSSSINDGSYGSKASSEQADYVILAHMPAYIPWSVNLEGEDYYVSPSYGPHKTPSSAVSADMAGWNYFATSGNGSGQLTESNSLTANFALNYDLPFLKGLSLKASYAVSRTNSNTEQVQLPYTLARAKKIGQNEDLHLYGAHQDFDNIKDDWEIKENKSKARVSYDDVFFKNEQMNLFINYQNTFGKHSISGMFGIERAENEAQEKRMLYDNPIAGIYNGTSSTAGTLDTSNSVVRKSESGSLSYIGRLIYNYDEKYIAQFLFRTDASTKFAPKNYWGFFPSLSVGWIASEESWFKDNISWINYSKVRLSIGKTGRDNIKPWRWKQMYGYATDKGLGFGNSGGLYTPGLTPKVSPNPDAKWDSDIKYNLGLDLNFLKNRLTLTYDFYFDKNTDMFTDMASAIGTPISSGGGQAEFNYAKLNAWGHEFSINWRDVIGEVKYDIGVNFGFSDNKILKYPEQSGDYPSKETTRMREGYSNFFPIWGYKVWRGTSGGDGILRTDEDVDAYWNYLSENAANAGTTPSYFDRKDKSEIKKGMVAYQDVAGSRNEQGTLDGPNGRIVKDEDMTKLKNSNRTYGFTTNLRANWKNLSWSAQVATSWGGLRSIDYVKQGTSSSHLLWAHESYLTDMYDEEYNTSGRYPNLAYYDESYVSSDFWNISTFRSYIKSMTLTYDLPSAWLKSTGISRTQLSLTGYNLWDFHNPYPKKYRNMYDSSYAAYPTLRTWSLGINLSF